MGLRSAPPAPWAPPPHKWGGARIIGSGSLLPTQETRRRLQRTPPRPGTHRVTRFWFLRRFTAVAYLWRPTFARTVGGPGRRTNCLHSATIRCQCQDLCVALASTTFEVENRGSLSERLIRERRGK